MLSSEDSRTEQPVTLLSPDEGGLAGFQSGSETSPQPDQQAATLHTIAALWAPSGHKGPQN